MVTINKQLNRSKLLMNYNSSKTLSENYAMVDDSIVITDWLSPDEKFVIFLDELYDINNKIHLGNIWENFENFKFFLKHSFEVAEKVPTVIRESVLTTINTMVITESNRNCGELKPIVKLLIQNKNSFKTSVNEGLDTLKKLGGDFVNWLATQPKTAVQGIKNFVKTSSKGAVDFISNVSKGDFKKAFDIITKGVLYVFRAIRGALYHPIGMVLDAILITTGIGKTVQWIPWAMVVALDIYEITTQDFEYKDQPLWMRILQIGTDILGLVFTGAVALAARKSIQSVMKGVVTTEQAAAKISKSPALQNIIKNMGEGLEKTPGLLKQASDYLSKVFPKGAEFFKSILGKVTTFITKITETLKKLAGSTQGLTTAQKVEAGAKAGAVTLGFTSGMELGLNKYAEYQAKKQERTNSSQPQVLSPETQQALASVSPEEIDKIFSS